MFRRTLAFSILVAALNPVTRAVADEEGAFQTLTVPQLCEQRDIPEAWAELERRSVFSQRDLRSIERGRIRSRLTEAALFCFMGEPESVLPAGFNIEGEPIDAYIYPGDGTLDIVVRVRHGLNESTVIDVQETAANPRQPD
jgi:hypothetical protein